MKRLTRNEEVLLLAVLKLKEEAYTVSIRDILCEYSDSDVGFGTLYNNLDQLIKKGLATSYKGDPTSERGGKRKVFYKVTAFGIESLKYTREHQIRILRDFPETVFETE